MHEEEKKSLTRTIGEAGFFLSLGNIVGKLAALLSAIVVIRYLSVYDYGLWQLILSAAGIFSIISLPGLENFLIADLSGEIARQNLTNYRQLLKKFFQSILALSLLAAILLFICAPLIGNLTSKDLTLYIRILAFFALLNAVRRFYTTVLYANLKFFQLSIFKSADSVFHLILVLILVFFYQQGLLGVAIAYLGASFISCLVFSPLIIKEIAGLKSKEKSEAKNIFWQSLKRHGKWSLADDYFNDLLTNLRPWLIGFFLNAEALAIFSVAKNLFGHLTTLIPLEQIIKPIIPRQIIDKDKFRLFFSRSVKYSVWFSAAIAIIAFIFMPYFIETFFPQYLISLPLFNILLIALFGVSLTAVINQTYYALKAQKVLFFSTFVKVLSIGLILPLLIKAWGLSGIAAESVILIYLLFLVRYYLLKRKEEAVHLAPSSFVRFDNFDKILVKKILNKLIFFRRFKKDD